MRNAKPRAHEEGRLNNRRRFSLSLSLSLSLSALLLGRTPRTYSRNDKETLRASRSPRLKFIQAAEAANAKAFGFLARIM
jgi:hypothetical protein